jgi:sugar phosphate permease
VAARHARSTAVGLYVSFYYVGGSLGAVLPAGLWHRAGWPGCVGLVVSVQCVMLAIALAFWHEREPGKR